MKTIMCRYFLLNVIIFSVGCSKKDDTTNAVPSKTIQVVEYKTNSPLIGASIEYFTPCPLCAIQPAFTRVFSSKTSYDGKCEVPESIFNNTGYGVIITPPLPPQNQPGLDYSYWPAGSAGTHSSTTLFELPIAGDERLHLLKTSNFPRGYYMEIKATGEKTDFPVIDIARVYAFPSDTTFDFFTYRGQTNTITWKIFDSTDVVISAGGPITIDFPRTGINEMEVKY